MSVSPGPRKGKAGDSGPAAGKRNGLLSGSVKERIQDRCMPPVTPKTSAVMKLDSWDARKT